MRAALYGLHPGSLSRPLQRLSVLPAFVSIRHQRHSVTSYVCYARSDALQLLTRSRRSKRRSRRERLENAFVAAVGRLSSNTKSWGQSVRTAPMAPSSAMSNVSPLIVAAYVIATHVFTPRAHITCPRHAPASRAHATYPPRRIVDSTAQSHTPFLKYPMVFITRLLHLCPDLCLVPAFGWVALPLEPVPSAGAVGVGPRG